MADNSLLKMTSGVDTSWGIITWEQTISNGESYIKVNILDSNKVVLESNIKSGFDLSTSSNITSTADVYIQIKWFTLTDAVQVWNIRLHPKVRDVIQIDYKNKMLEILMGDASDTISHFGIGTGTTAPQASDTELQTAIIISGSDFRKTIQSGSEFNTGDVEVQIVGHLPTTAANGENLTEFGLFTALTDGTMINRVSFDAESKTDSIEYYFTVTLKLT